MFKLLIIQQILCVTYTISPLETKKKKVVADEILVTNLNLCPN